MSDASVNFVPLPYASPAPASAGRYHRALHVLAVLTTCATFPLIFLGGLVTSHQAGMSVPDWPNSYGYNMFTFPPSKWVGGILYEHTHRLLGSLVGLFATLLFLAAYGWGRDPQSRRRLLASGLAMLALTVVAAFVTVLRTTHLFELFAFFAVLLIGASLFRNPEPRRWVRRLTLIVLVGVIFQGFLGGLRVRLAALPLAVIHGCFAQAFFCLSAFAAVATSRWWAAAPLPGTPEGGPGSGARPQDAGSQANDGAPGGAARATATPLAGVVTAREEDSLSHGIGPAALDRALSDRRRVAEPLSPALSPAYREEGVSRWTVRVALVAVIAIFLQLVVGALMRHYQAGLAIPDVPLAVGSSRVDLQACKLEYSIVSPK